MNKPSRAFAKPLRELVGKVVGEAFMRQGFASAELVTRWSEIVGTEIATHSEPIKIQWPRRTDPQIRNDGTAALQLAATMPEIADEELRRALARLLAGVRAG